MSEIIKKNYILNLDNESKTLEIKCGKSFIFMIFPEFDFSKTILSDNGFTIIDAMENINVTYTASNNSIKEEIVLKSKYHVNKFTCNLLTKNCSIFFNQETKKHIIIGEKGREILSFGNLVSYNSFGNIDNFANIDYNIQSGDMIYRFGKRIESEYPITVDPTFSFPSKIGTSSIGDVGFQNSMYVVGKSSREKFIEESATITNPDTGSSFRQFSSDDVLFEKSVAVVFPYLSPNNVDLVTLNIEHNGNVSSISFKSGGDLKSGSYLAGQLTVNYVYVEFDLKSNLAASIKISAKIGLDKSIYGEFSLSFFRTISFVPRVDLSASQESAFYKKQDTLLESNAFVGHSSIFSPKEYLVFPFEFNDDNVEKYPETTSFDADLIKIENSNPNRINAHFNFDPDILPAPSFIDSRIGSSSEIDMETLFKTMAGMDYSLLDEDGNPMPKYYKITNVGDWEFWAFYPNINYNLTNASLDIRAYIAIKNNSKFKRTVLITLFGGQGSFKKEWKNQSVNSNDFWQMFYDNTGTSERDFFNKIADEYIVNKKNPYSSNGVGIDLTVPFRRIVDLSKPEEFLEMKCSIKVSGNNYFDIIYEYLNTTSEKLKNIGNSNAQSFIYASNFFQYNQGINIDKRTKYHINFKRNDFRDSQFDWIPANRDASTIDGNSVFSSLFGVTGSTQASNSNVFIYSDARNYSNIEVKPGNMVENGDFELFEENLPKDWFLLPSDSENSPITSPEESIVFSGSKSLRWSHDGSSVGLGISDSLKFPSLSQGFPIGDLDTIRDKRLHYSYKIRSISGTNKTRTNIGYGAYDDFHELPPDFGDLEVSYDSDSWKTVSGYFDLKNIPDSKTNTFFLNNEVRILIRPTSEDSVQEAIIDDIEVSLLSSTQTEPPTDPKNDIRFISSEKDPRWYSGRIYAELINNSAEPNSWPYLKSHDLWRTDDNTSDAWYFKDRIEPFIVFDRELPSYDPEIGVLAIVSENPYGIFYDTRSVISNPKNEYLSLIGVNSGLLELPAKSSDTTKVRFYFDTENGSRESWYNNVFLHADFSKDDYFAASSSGTSQSFKNNMEVVLKSGINDRTNLESGNRFKKPYTIIDSGDIFFAINNNDGTVVPGKIAIANDSFDLYTVQKTNFIYQKESNKDLRFYSNVSEIKFRSNSPDDPSVFHFTVGSKIKQETTNATAIVAKETIDDEIGHNRTLYVHKVKKEFDSINSFIEIEGFSGTSGAKGYPLANMNPVCSVPHVFVDLVLVGENNEPTGSDDILFEEFDRPYRVNIKGEIFPEDWGLKKLSDDIFAGGFFHYEIGSSLKTSKIISNKISHIILDGSIKDIIINIDRFALTLFNPLNISFDFTGNYKQRKETLQKRGFSTDGNIIYKPINLDIELANNTEIFASVFNENDKFGGISQKVEISGETIFELSGTLESPVRVFGYVISENDSGSLNPEKIPPPLGGSNMDVIVVPKNMSEKTLFLDVRTAFPSQNVRAIINQTSGESIEIEATESLSNKRFIVKINQTGISYNTIEIIADPATGGSLDSLGLVSKKDDVGISLEKDVITKTLYKAVDYSRTRDFFEFDDFNSIVFTSIQAHGGNKTNRNRMAIKTLMDGFVDSAVVHTTSDHVWFSPAATTQPAAPSLFIPAYAKDSTKISDNYWKKIGSENMMNYINYKNSSGLDLRLNMKYYLQERKNWFFTQMEYINRGVDINNLVMLYRLDLHNLLQFLPDSLILPKTDFSPEEKMKYDEKFRNYVSRNFFFTLPDNSQVGIASQNLLQGAGPNINVGDSVIYPIGYDGISQNNLLPIGEIISKLEYNDENISDNIKVSTKNIGVSFYLNKKDGTGKIEGILYFEGDQFTKQSMELFQLTNNDYIRPFLGHSGAGDSILYGAGLKKLEKNKGFFIGVIFRYVEL